MPKGQLVGQLTADRFGVGCASRCRRCGITSRRAWVADVAGERNNANAAGRFRWGNRSSRVRRTWPRWGSTRSSPIARRRQHRRDQRRPRLCDLDELDVDWCGEDVCSDLSTPSTGRYPSKHDHADRRTRWNSHAPNLEYGGFLDVAQRGVSPDLERPVQICARSWFRETTTPDAYAISAESLAPQILGSLIDQGFH